MNNKNAYSLFLFFAFCFLLFVTTSCFNPLGSFNETIVTVRLGGSGSRAVCFPEDNYTENDIDYEVKFTNTGTKKVIPAAVTKDAETVNATARIFPGVWKINVTAKFSPSAPPPAVPGEIYAEGSEIKNIRESQTIIIAMKRYDPGNGTEDTPFKVYNAATLGKVGSGKDGWTLKAHYIQTENITLPRPASGQSNWTPIGEYDSSFNPDDPSYETTTGFTGIYNGDGLTISNITINTDYGYDVQGLFGWAYGATIKNVKLVNVSMDCYNGGCGLAGRLDNSIVENCSVSGNISGGSGLVGEMYDTTLKNCSISGNVSCGTRTGGGVVGRSVGGEITGCSFTSGTVRGYARIGGIVGDADGTIMKNCYVSGDVSTAVAETLSNYIGGLAGNFVGYIENCYVTGNVTCSSNSYVGGLVGSYSSDGDWEYDEDNDDWIYTPTGVGMINCYTTGDVISTGYYGGGIIGGLVGENSGCISNCYATGNVISETCVGGLIGSNGGTVENCVALNMTINRAYSTDTTFGRIAGENNGTLTNNFARSDMGGNVTGEFTETNDYEKDGADFMIGSSLSGVFTPGNGWDTDVWTIPGGNLTAGCTLPTLKNMPAQNPRLYGFSGSQGNGTQNNPFKVYDLATLKKVGSGTGGWNLDVYYVQTEKIYVFETLTPIGSDTSPFTGTYDGGNLNISYLSVGDEYSDYQGLFSCASGATIKNIKLVNATIIGKDYSGGIVGAIYNNTKLENCSASGQVNNWSTDGSFAGGVVGYSENSTITGCSFATVTGFYNDTNVFGIDSVGGVVGSANHTTMTNCYADSGVQGTSNVGGLAGSFSDGNITNCSAGGAQGDGDCVGGLVGSMSGGNITDCSAGSAQGNGDCVGGLVGSMSGGSITNCYASDARGNCNVGGLVGLFEGDGLGASGTTKIINCYTTGEWHSGNGDNIGGLIGLNIYGYIQNCYTTGEVRGGSNVGGLVGANDVQDSGYPERAIISKCYTTGNVIASGSNCGGVAGNNSGTISDCYATGDIEGINYIGGIAGSDASASLIKNSYASGIIKGENLVGGVIGSNNGIVQNCVALSPIITRNASSSGVNFGRITNKKGATLTGNYARGTMGGNVANLFTDKTSTEKDGADFANGSALSGVFSAGNGWSSSVWTISGNLTVGDILPTLKNMQDGTQKPRLQSSPGDRFKVTNIATLKKVGTGTDGWTLAAHYEQTAPINMAGQSWTPIGSGEYSAFTGSYNGGGYAISNFTINVSGYGRGIGLFGNTNRGAVIENIRLDNVNINAPNSDYVGGIVGYVFNSTAIRNCRVSGTITAGSYVGGIVGGDYYAREGIENCYSMAAVNGSYYVGGIAGHYAGLIDSCIATGNVTSTGESAGGIVGYNSNGTIQNCYATGNVKGTNNVGGLTGFTWDGRHQNCYATGNVEGDNYVGGLLGGSRATSYSIMLIRSCVALNKNVTAAGTSTNVGKIAGQYYYTAQSPQSVYSRSDMAIVRSSAGTYAVDGTNVTPQEALLPAWWTSGSWSGGSFSGTTWNAPSGSTLPTLKNMPTGTTQNPVLK